MISIARALSLAAEAAPDSPAVTCAGQTLSREELRRRSNRLAWAYAELGVGIGDYVTIALGNSVEFMVACVAVWKLGAVPQPVSHRLPHRERDAIIKLAGSVLVVGAEEGAHPGFRCLPQGWEPNQGLPESDLPDVVSPAWKAPTSGGSTGRPKLIVSGDPGWVDLDVPQMLQRPDGVSLVAGPMYHSAGFTVAGTALFHGNHVVLLERFDAEATLAAVDAHGVDWMLLVPTMMSRIWRLPESVRARYDVSSLRVVWHMAAPCPAWLKEAWIQWLGPKKIYELYGGTENQAVTIIRGDQWLAHRGSAGRARVGEIRVCDPDTFAPLPSRQVGEVFMRSAHRDAPAYRYIGAEARVTPDGWESLGDMGWMDEEGYLYLVDRRSDMILSGGANIYPAEIEAALSEHDNIISSAVVGIPDEDLGQRVHAVIQLSTDAGRITTADDIRAFLGERLVRYKIPRTFEFTTEEVRDDAGKVRRSAIRDNVRTTTTT